MSKKKFTRLSAVLAILSSTILFGLSPATAHMGVASSNPANGSQIERSPEQANIKFSTSVNLDSAAARLRFIGDLKTPITEVNNKDVPTETLTKISGEGEGSEVSFRLPKLSNGLYAIDWAVEEIGGHGNNSSIIFKVTNASTGGVNLALVIILIIFGGSIGYLFIRRKI